MQSRRNEVRVDIWGFPNGQKDILSGPCPSTSSELREMVDPPLTDAGRRCPLGGPVHNRSVTVEEAALIPVEPEIKQVVIWFPLSHHLSTYQIARQFEMGTSTKVKHHFTQTLTSTLTWPFCTRIEFKVTYHSNDHIRRYVVPQAV